MSLFKHISIVGLSVVAALIVAEYAIRTVDPQITIDSVQTPYTFDCFTKGSYYWVGMKQKATCILHSLDGAFQDIHIQTTDLGLRSDTILKEKKSTSLRILVLGDSFSFGWGVPFEQSYPERLKEYLARQYPDRIIEILNASIPAAGPDYYYLFLKKEGLAFTPDIILVGFNMFNDITYNMSYSVWDTVDEQGLPLSASSSLDMVNDGRILPKTFPISLRTPFLNHSHLFVKLATMLSKGISTTTLSPSWYICYYKPGCHDLDTSIEKTKKLFSSIQALGNTIGASTIVAMIPEEIQIQSGLEKKYAVPVLLLPSDMQRPITYWNSFFNSAGIDHIDLTKSLQSESERTYFEKEIHWNAMGHEIAATTIASEISRIIAAQN